MLSISWSAKVWMASALAHATCGVRIKVRQTDKPHEGMIGRRRLNGRYVEGRSRDLALPQRKSEVLFVHEAAAGRVDEERPRSR
jgi:hypothetical protein